jgi:hypothetical protein
VSPDAVTHPFGLQIKKALKYNKASKPPVPEGLRVCFAKEKVEKGRNARATSFYRKRADRSLLALLTSEKWSRRAFTTQRSFHSLQVRGPAHTGARRAGVKQLGKAWRGLKNCARGADRPNCHMFALSYSAAGRVKAASIPAAARSHCILSARDLKCWRLFLACAVGRSILGVH